MPAAPPIKNVLRYRTLTLNPNRISKSEACTIELGQSRALDILSHWSANPQTLRWIDATGHDRVSIYPLALAVVDLNCTVQFIVLYSIYRKP